MKNSTLILKTAVTLLFLGAFLTRCATIMSPDGGPKDTLPPVIVNITPGNFKTNFSDKDKKIYIGDNDILKMHLLNSAVKMNTERGRGKLVKINQTARIDGTAALADAICVRQKWYAEIGAQLKNEG
mgnify:CR=1 FL=1